MKNFFKELLSYVIIIAITFGLTTLVTKYVIQQVQVDGRSMYDTLEDGERLWMYRLANIDRFDIVVFPDPSGTGKLFVKRVIGLPGDTLAVKDDQLILNGHALAEPYLENNQAQFNGNFTDDFTVTETVPEGKVFVMGDNRQNSLDSRVFGFVDIDNIEGEAHWVFWPFSKMHFLTAYELSADGTAILTK